MKKLSVFANFFINDEETFLRMRDSFLSFYKGNIYSWVINVRGKFSDSSIKFLKTKLKNKDIYISNIDTNNWRNDSILISKKIKSKYIFFWTEDHICLVTKKNFNSLLEEVIKNNLDYLQYSWFLNGIMLNSMQNINYKEGKNIIHLKYTKEIMIKRFTWYKNKGINQLFDYIISQQSVMKTQFFKKILEHKNLTFFKKNLPFFFEKNFRHTYLLPIRIGIVKKEFFASIDDDHYAKNYSLIKRKLYPDRLSWTQKKIIIKNRKNGQSRYNLIGQFYYSSFLLKIKSLFK